MFLSVGHEKNVIYSKLVNNPFNVQNRKEKEIYLSFLYITYDLGVIMKKVFFSSNGRQVDFSDNSIKRGIIKFQRLVNPGETDRSIDI